VGVGVDGPPPLLRTQREPRSRQVVSVHTRSMCEGGRGVALWEHAPLAPTPLADLVQCSGKRTI